MACLHQSKNQEQQTATRRSYTAQHQPCPTQPYSNPSGPHANIFPLTNRAPVAFSCYAFSPHFADLFSSAGEFCSLLFLPPISVRVSRRMGSFLARFGPLKKFKGSGHYIKAHLNFYRIHILFLCVISVFASVQIPEVDPTSNTDTCSVFTPLIFSAILYGSDGREHISYIDALFNSISAVTVCGLTTVDLSGLTNFQQAVLFFLMCIGNPVSVF